MLNIGNLVTKGTVDSAVGSAAAKINRGMRQAYQISNWLTDIDDSDLTGLGYTSDDITALRAAITSMSTLHSIYVGDATLDPAVDFRTTIRTVLGINDTD